MNPTFWNDRYSELGLGLVYGKAPTAFIAEQAHWFPRGSTVVDVGAGEGRNAAFFAARGCSVTAVDYAAEGLAKITQLPGGKTVETIQANIKEWKPGRCWDGAVCTFLHLPPDDRPALYQLLQHVLQPGGVLVAEWFRPAHHERGLHGGPPLAELMVTAVELAKHFPPAGVTLLTEADVVLDEGRGHQGEAAVVRLVWGKPQESPEKSVQHR